MLVQLLTVAVYSTKKIFRWIKVASASDIMIYAFFSYLQYFSSGYFGQGSQEDKKQPFVHIFAHLIEYKPSKNTISHNHNQ